MTDPTPQRSLRLDDLYRFERLSDPALHPDGSLVAYTVTTADDDSDDYRSQIWAVPFDGGQPRAYTNGTQDGSPVWSPDGRWLAFLRTGDDGPQLWVLPTGGGDGRRVDAGPVAEFVWSPDSTRFAVVRPLPLEGSGDDDTRTAEPVVIDRLGYKADGTGLLKGLTTQLFLIPLQGGDARQLTSGDASVSGPAWAPEGTSIAVLTATHDFRDLDAVNHVALLDVEGGETRLLTDWDGIAGWVGWLPDGDRLLLAGAGRVDTATHTSLFTLPADGGKPEPLLPSLDRNVMIGGPGYPGAEPAVIGNEIVFCARDRGSVHLYAAPLHGGPARKLAGDDHTLISGASVAGDRIAFVVADRARPGDIAARTLRDDSHRLLTHHSAFLDDIGVHRAQDRTFTAPGGQQVHGRVLFAGSVQGPRPLLLDIHGGPHNAWAPVLEDVHLYHQVLTEQGWAVLTLNTVGSDGYGQDWYAGLRGAWGHNDEPQFLAAVDALIAEGLADPERIAVTGYSYGGYMTNWLLSRTDRFAAAVTGGCVTNLASFYGTADLGPLLLRSELSADLAEDPQVYADMSPLTRASTVTTPTLILHGEEDDRCPVGQAEEWFAALRRAGTKVRMVRYPGASHLFILSGRPSHRLHYNQQVVDWITEHAS